MLPLSEQKLIESCIQIQHVLHLLSHPVTQGKRSFSIRRSGLIMASRQHKLLIGATPLVLLDSLLQVAVS